MTRLHHGRTMLCSALAIATAMLVGASPASAQALLGTVTSSSGVGPIGHGVGTTVIPVTSQQAVINWSATGPSNSGVTTFSTPGSSTSFTGTSNFAVLNRVAPSVGGDAILMGGDIRSTINGQVGGTVYFYSPNGIVIGANASINVGSLGLTTLPIADADGVWMSGFGTAAPQVAFGTAGNAASFVRTFGGGTGAISANGYGHYVALVAPRVEHRGTIRTDGGAALVAASAATITFNPTGLYDIVVTSGSSDANGVVVDGGAIERNASAVGGDHRAYLVAVPANNAMTMLVQGGARLGFDIAGSAGVEGNVVVLAAGRNVFGGVSTSNRGKASATIDHATIGSSLVMDASSGARIVSGAGATLLAGNVKVAAVDTIDVVAQNHRLDIGGSLTATADNISNEGIGGTITLAARNGQRLGVAGDVIVSAGGYGFGAANDGVNAGNGIGGAILLQAAGGATIDLRGALNVAANGSGGLHLYANGAGGAGRGGTISVDASGSNSAILVGGAATFDANGSGGFAIDCTSCAIRGGSGTGGAIDLGGTGSGRIAFGGGVAMSANGLGGSGDAAVGAGRGGRIGVTLRDGTIVDGRAGWRIAVNGVGGDYFGSGAGNGGDGTGGEAQLGALGASTMVNRIGAKDAITLSAQGRGGAVLGGSGAAGIGQGGRLAIVADRAALEIGAALALTASGIGGTAGPGSGGAGTGGVVQVAARDGGTLTLLAALAGDGSGTGGAGLRAGAGLGGTVELGATGSNSTIEARRNLSLVADGHGAIGATGGSGTGGLAVAQTNGGVGNRVLIGGDLRLAGGGFGGGGIGEIGGIGQGGTARLAISDDGRFAVGGVLGLGARGEGGDQAGRGVAGAGSGGDAEITLGDNATASLTVGSASGAGIDRRTTVDASGRGGSGVSAGAAGGTGTGGWARITGTGGSAALTGDVTVAASGVGGNGQDGAGGTGLGGRAALNADGAAIALGAGLAIDASARGGAGRDGGAASLVANGNPGNAAILVNRGGSVRVAGGSTLDASATGGAGAGGAGGAAMAGAAQVVAGDPVEGRGTITLGTLAARADATGGAGASGGGAGGGRVALTAHSNPSGTSALGSGNAVLSAFARGGTGAAGDGGGAVGGTIGATAIGGSARLATLALAIDASGSGGSSGGGKGGNARGGAITLGVEQGVTAPTLGAGAAFGTVTATANATGGAGTNGGSAHAAAISVIALGGSLTSGAISATANSVGGNGTSGAGGDAVTGTLLLRASHAPGQPAWRATMTLGDYLGSSSASGGSGSIAGRAIALGGASFDLLGSDVRLASFRATIGGGGAIDPAATGDRVRLRDANATIDGAFALGTDHPLSVHLDGSGLEAGSFAVAAPNIVDDRELGLPARMGTISAGSIDVRSGQDILLDAHLASVASLTLNARGFVKVADLRATGAATGSDVSVTGGTTVTTGAITASRAVDVVAGGNVLLGSVIGSPIRIRSNTASVAGDDLIANESFVQINAADSITIDALSADSIAIAAGGDIATGALGAAVRGIEISAGRTLTSAALGARTDIKLSAGGAILTGAIASLTGEISAIGKSNISTGNLAAGGGVTLDARGAISTGTIAARWADLFAVGPINVAAATTSEYFDAESDATLTLATVNAGTSIALRAGGAMAAAMLNARNDIVLDAGGTIITGAIGSQSGAIRAIGKGDVTTATLAAGGTVDFEARGTLSTGAIAARAAKLFAVGPMTVGAATTTQEFGADSLTSLTLATVSAGASIGLRSAGTLTSDVLNANNDVVLDAAGALNTVAIASQSGAIRALGKANITTGNLAAGGAVEVDARGALSTGTIAAQSAKLFAVGPIDVGNVTTARGFEADSDATLTLANVTAGEAIDIAARGALVAGNLAAGPSNANVRTGAGYHVGIVSPTSVTIASASARDLIAIGTKGTLTAGVIATQGDVVLAADGAVQTGAITTGSQGRLLIAGADMATLGGLGGNFDRSRLFAALGTSEQAATKGAVTISEAVSTGRLDALVGTNFTTVALTATGAAYATVGGTMAIGGAWVSPLTRIVSNDIAIGASGAIGGARIELISSNATQLLVGDGLTGTGYALDNGEFGRLSGSNVSVTGRGDASAAIETLVGTLSLSGRSGGSNVTISTAGNGSGQPVGSLRVVGPVSGTGFGANDVVTLAAGRVEVEATKGGVSLRGAGGALGGVLSLVGQRIHVAEAVILDRLAIDPNYASRDIDLAKAPAIQRPDGVVRAGEIVVDLVAAGAAATSVLVQNVGTQVVPAGFAATNVEILSRVDGAGLIDLMINGQLVTPEGILIGVAVRDKLIEDDDPARFAGTSLIDGCALVGQCVLRPPPPPVDPQPTISTEIQLNTGPAAVEGDGASDDANEEDGGEDGAAGPITPPVPLFNTKPLEHKGETDEPVSGGGNPALIGDRPVEGAI